MRNESSLVCPISIRIVLLDYSQSNSRNTILILTNVEYIPESPLNWLLGLKLIATSGYTCNSKLLTKFNWEFY